MSSEDACECELAKESTMRPLRAGLVLHGVVRHESCSSTTSHWQEVARSLVSRALGLGVLGVGGVS